MFNKYTFWQVALWNVTDELYGSLNPSIMCVKVQNSRVVGSTLSSILLSFTAHHLKTHFCGICVEYRIHLTQIPCLPSTSVNYRW